MESDSREPSLLPQGDMASEAAFTSFYKAFTPRLVGFLMIQGATLEEAADVAQETMIRAAGAWLSLRHPKAWARTVASREFIRRALKSVEDPDSDVTEGAMLISQSVDPSYWETHYSLVLAIRSLPIRQRQVMAWTMEGYAPREIAAELQISAENVRSNLKKARQKLAEFLSDEREV